MNRVRITVAVSALVSNTFAEKLSADPIVQFRLETTDLAGIPVAQVAVGDQFQLRAYVQDVRMDAPYPGVGVAFLDVTYDAALGLAIGPVVHSADYPNAPSGSTAIPGIVDEAGGLQTFPGPLGPDERLLFSVLFRADLAGIMHFASDPADVLPNHFTATWEPVAVVPIDEIIYGSASLAIVPEPAGMALLALGGCLVALLRRPLRRPVHPVVKA